MPYTYPDKIPKVAKNWTAAEQQKCTKAANSVLRDGGSEEDAIFACINAAGKSKGKKMEEKEINEEMEQKSWGYVPHGATTFADLDNARTMQQKADDVVALTLDFRGLVYNVLDNDEIMNKAQAVRQLATEFEARVKTMEEIQMEAKSMDEDEDDEDECPDGEDCEDIQEKKGVVERFSDFLAKTFKKPEQESPGFMLVKNKQGNWAWFARYSNKWRDNDRPPEIISEASHRRFAQLVKEGKAPFPELWLWHVPGTAWGKATWVGYDSKGFALAAGYVYPEYEEVAEALKGQKDILLSHGMPNSTIKRDADDSSVIVEHETREISPLPKWAAANKLTGFVILQENGMDELKGKGLEPEDRRKLVEEMGIPESAVDAFEKDSAFLAQVADKAGLESKEASKEEEAAVEPETEKAPPVEETPQVGVTDAVLEEHGKSLEHILVAMEALGNQVKALTEELISVKSAQQEQAAKMIDTPLASRASLLMKTIVGEEAALVDGRTKLGSDGPAETKEKSTFFWQEWAS